MSKADDSARPHDVDPSAPTSIVNPAMPTAARGSSGDGDHAEIETRIYASPSFSGDLRGHRIGNYRIEERIGGGGMGVVYLARQDNPRRHVAIKLMRQGITSKSARARFGQEAELVARLTHPAVAQVFEAGMHLPPDAPDADHAIPFFAMEYVRDGKPLTAYAAINHLSIPDRLKLFIEVCRGVEHGHRQGVIHRDLKPANILVNDSGQPKIIDYGVAVCIKPEEATPRHTETGQIVGTIQYMSPEQLSGSKTSKLDPRSDIYALGVILYELICRRLPYDVDGRSLVEATRVILDHPPVSPRQHIGSIDVDLETIVLHALDKNRVTRFQTVGELIEQCEKYLRGEMIDIKPVSRLTKTWRRSVDVATRRYEWAALGIIAFATIIAGDRLDALLHNYTNVKELTFHALLTYASPYSGGVPLRGVEMISVTPGTDLAGASQRAGTPPAGIDDLKTVRPLYGALLQRLAALPSRPRAVLLDVRFRADQAPELDGPLAEGVRALARPREGLEPVDVICALGSCEPDAEGYPVVARSLFEAGIRYGDPSVHIGEAGAQWVHPKVVLATKNPRALAIPGIALHTYLSARYPGAEFLVERDLSRLRLQISAHQRTPGGTIGTGKLKGEEYINYLSAASVKPEDIEFGIQPDAIVPIFEVRMPSEDHLRSHDLDLARALQMSDEGLAERFGGKILVIGIRETAAETFELAENRQASGMDIHAAAIASLLQGISISQGDWFVFPILATADVTWSALGAIAGVTIGTFLPRRTWPRIAALACAFILLAGAAWAAMRFADTYFNPVPVLASVILASEASALLSRARMLRREHQPWRFA
ncbi:MAG TPA: protein kinase [Phycisphaerales bacterium]|nr:protein kinase [Phycisphaerales bacterium]